MISWPSTAQTVLVQVILGSEMQSHLVGFHQLLPRLRAVRRLVQDLCWLA